PDDRLIDLDLEKKMSLIRRTTNLGRSLRAQHQIRTRQALPSMLIITRTTKDQELITSGRGIISEELNIKELQFTTEEAKFVRLSVKPNLRSLGPRLGKNLGKLRAHFDELNKSHDAVAKFLEEVETKGQVECLGHKISVEDLLIERGPKDNRLIA